MISHLVVDVVESSRVELQTERLPLEFGKELDTVAKARLWLTNPHNWHEGDMFVLRWNGLVPTVCRRHGLRLAMEPWDDGLPTVVVREQRDIRRGKREEERPPVPEE